MKITIITKLHNCGQCLLSVVCCLLTLTSCMEWEYGLEEDFDASGEGLFICNEGNFQYGNATLSYYEPETKKVENEVFYRANAMKLGDVAQSMIIRNGIGWVVVNNSHVVFAIDINTYRIDAETFTIEKQFKFKLGDAPSEVQLNGTKDKLYWINDDIWEMYVTAERIPLRPFLQDNNTIYYGLTVCPRTGDIYIADAIDYVQQGMIYRYSKNGNLLDEFYVGIIPGAFCWK